MSKSGPKLVSLVLQTRDVKNSVKSFALSKKYVNRLVKISMINIVYRRIDVPQSEFQRKSYQEVPYMIFKRKSQNKTVRATHAISMGIIDAIEKDYLKEVTMYILHKTTREPLETYNIKIKYNKEDKNPDQNANMVMEATTEFLQAFSEIPGTKWDEENVELFVELSYNDETPKEYEPPNFEAAKSILSSDLNKFVSLGKISTGFHKVSAWGRGMNFIASRASTPAPIVVEDSQKTSFPEETQKSTQSGKRPNKGDEPELEMKRRKSTLNTSTDEVNWETVSIVSSVEYVRCICAWDLPEEYQRIKCTKCYGTVHLACHGFMSSETVDKTTFTCFTCSDNKNVEGDLLMIVKLRAILYGIHLNKSIPSELQLASETDRKYIFGQLEKFGVRSKAATSIEDINWKAFNKAVLVVFQSENSQNLE